MLGIRHLDSFAFDLWVGDARDFYVDCWVLPKECSLDLSQGAHAQVVHLLKFSDYLNLVHDETLSSLILAKNLRHLALLGLADNQDDVEKEFNSLFELVRKPIVWPKKMRISFVLADQTYYKRYQACLFALCPE